MSKSLPEQDVSSTGANRILRGNRKPTLPAPRLIIGVVLVCLAMAATFGIATGAIKGQSQSAVVATRDISPGQRLELGDLRVIDVSIDSTTKPQIASSPTQLQGLVTLGPVRAGELLQAGNVTKKASNASNPEISLALPASRALGGKLRNGEIVDVVTTNKTSDNSTARTAAAGATVVNASSGDGELGGTGDVIITLAVSDAAKAADIAAAVDLGNVTLVRVTGVRS